MKSINHLVLTLGLLGCGLAAPATTAWAGDVRVGVDIGLHLPAGAIRVMVGHDPYFYHEGNYYRHTPRGYVAVRPPRGARVRALPRSYVRVVIGGDIFFRDGDIYYRLMPGGFYEVCEPPIIVEAPPVEATTEVAAESTSDPVDANGYLTVWLGEDPYYLKAGQFFRKTSKGYVTVDPPIGAITKQLPKGAVSVWHEEREYFESGGALFKETKDGFVVIEPPWKVAKE